MANMLHGTLRLKGAVLKSLAEANNKNNANKASKWSGVSWPSIEDYYWKDKSPLESIHLPSLVGLLIGAGGISAKDLLDMRIGDLFEYVPNGSE